MTVIRRPSRARWSVASRRRSCASATSNCRPCVATSSCCARWSTSASPAISRVSTQQARRKYADWFGEVCERTARLVAEWMRVGFVHGVLNTDNMSILGLTIDYGPYGWVEDYDPDWTPNTTDAQGRRYRFGWQPRVAYWNLGKLAQALSPLFDGPRCPAGRPAAVRRCLRGGRTGHYRAQAGFRRMPRWRRRADPRPARPAACT